MPLQLDPAQLRERLREFVCEAFLVEDPDTLDDDTSLLATGILDSTGVLELVAHLEETYGIEILDEDIVPENLDSIERIGRFVQQRRSV